MKSKSINCQSALNTREVRFAIKSIYLFHTELASFEERCFSMNSITTLKETKYSGV